MEGYKLIDAYVFNPAFKNVKARCELTYCNNTDNCNHYKQGKCVVANRILSSIRCPHSRRTVEEGYTQRAKSFYSWQTKRKEKYKDVLNAITTENSKLCVCGDYVYLPYPHLRNYVNSLSFITNEYFCKLEDFTLDNIITIIKFRPQAMMGGEIRDFQTKHVKTFIQHLKEEMPEIFKGVSEQFPDLVEKHIDKIEDYVGRTAYIKTLKIGSELYKDGKFVWNGEKLISDDYKGSFMPFGIKVGYLELVPEDNHTVKITNNSQVDENTKFKD